MRSNGRLEDGVTTTARVYSGSFLLFFVWDAEDCAKLSRRDIDKANHFTERVKVHVLESVFLPSAICSPARIEKRREILVSGYSKFVLSNGNCVLHGKFSFLLFCLSKFWHYLAPQSK